MTGIMAPVDQMTVRQIASDEFLQLEEPWNKMVEQDQSSTVFSTWEWLATYWKYFGGQLRLKVLVLENQGKLVAAAPLCVKTDDGTRRLQFIGTPYLDYSDFVSTIGEHGTRRLLEHIAREDSWDLIELDQLPQGSPTPDLLSATFDSAAFSASRWVCEVCPYITLPSDWSAYREKHVTVARKASYYLRKLRKAVDLQVYRKVGLRDPLMDVVFRLHQNRQKDLGHGGLFAVPRMQDFHRELAHKLSLKDRLLLSTLVADGVPISAIYGFTYREWYGAYISGIERSLSKFSPGLVHLALLIKELIESKLVREFDLMRGAEPYKFFLAHEKKTNGAVSIHRKL